MGQDQAGAQGRQGQVKLVQLYATVGRPIYGEWEYLLFTVDRQWITPLTTKASRS